MGDYQIYSSAFGEKVSLDDWEAVHKASDEPRKIREQARRQVETHLRVAQVLPSKTIYQTRRGAEWKLCGFPFSVFCGCERKH